VLAKLRPRAGVKAVVRRKRSSVDVLCDPRPAAVGTKLSEDEWSYNRNEPPNAKSVRPRKYDAQGCRGGMAAGEVAHSREIVALHQPAVIRIYLFCMARIRIHGLR